LSFQVGSAFRVAPLGVSMKQAIVARTDLGMGEGKLAAYEDTGERARKEWKGGGQKKVVLQGSGEDQLFTLADKAERKGLANAVIRDAGHTQLDPGTATAVAIGPGDDEIVDRVTGDLSLF
jgi:PTH2 family peptidyl-tRNA hydrolase